MTTPTAITENWKLWSCYCQDEGTVVKRWQLSSSGTPTTCFTNAAHTINPDSMVCELEIGPTATSIVQDSNGVTKGRIRYKGFEFSNIAPSTTSVQNIVWKFPVSVKAVMIRSSDSNEGDILDCYRYYQSYIHASAALTQAVAIGDTTIYLNPYFTLSPACTPGVRLVLDNGTNLQDLGDIIDVYSDRVVVSTAAAYAFATSGTAIKFSIAIAEGIKFGPGDRYDFGNETQGSSLFTKNSAVTIVYTNNSTTVSKSLNVILSMYW